jgi:hypothetical protein
VPLLFGKWGFVSVFLASSSPRFDSAPDTARGDRVWHCAPVYLTDEGLFDVPVGFFTYHGFLTITSSSRIISLD